MVKLTIGLQKLIKVQPTITFISAKLGRLKNISLFPML